MEPEEIQIVFLESMTFNEEPFYDIYRNIISRGNETIYIKNLNKRYHIASAINMSKLQILNKNLSNSKLFN